MLHALFLFACGLTGYTIGYRLATGEWWWAYFKKK